MTGFRFWPDFGFDFARNFEDFESADKIDVCKSGFRRIIASTNAFVHVRVNYLNQLFP